MSIESLIKLAGERDQPSAAGIERARSAARESWRHALTQAEPVRIRPRRWFPFALAAGLAAAVTAGALLWREAPVTVDVARVSAMQGDVRVVDADAPLAITRVLRSAELLATREGRVALALGDALSLRMDSHSRLRLDGVGHVTLLEGAVYVDSGGLNAHAPLRIDTPAGAVRHVGTQFQVQVHEGRTRVQVREGRVVIVMSGTSAVDLAAGDLADMAGAQIRLEHGQPGHGAEWEWAALTAPGFDIENRPLSEFLAWVAREHGWQLRFGAGDLQTRAQDIRLHGSMEGLDAAGMLERVSLITGVPLAVRDGVLWAGAAVPR
jgi:ferric-dicitrate binding protein FerR (iron transport regulator)